jgi:predicted ATP-dependent endonuclease of OLD family
VGGHVRLKSFHVENFRRLKSVRVELEEKTTIFVGANNSGKTSATHVFHRFLSKSSRFQIHDFSADCWDTFNSIDPSSEEPVSLPTILLDLWFDIEDDDDIHRAIRLLPGLDWENQPLGVRMQYGPKDGTETIRNYKEARAQADASRGEPGGAYNPWPHDFTDYLAKQLTAEYEIRYFVLDARECDENREPQPGYELYCIGPKASDGEDTVRSLLRVDFLHAQRHLSDADAPGRAENLTRRLSRYYERNLAQHSPDIVAMGAIAATESALNAHFGREFQDILTKISAIGYPGIANPRLLMKALLDPQAILRSNANVHYAIDSAETATLPDNYNGLGFKNLIYMAVEILDFHNDWVSMEGERPPIHLVMAEEPESHLHAQLQQVFIQNIFQLLGNDADPGFRTQVIVTTHSSHIVYAHGFESIRYFRRSRHAGKEQRSDVKDLRSFRKGKTEEAMTFLQQYLKLAHCDLFFADAAILVEGNVERLLLPLIIQNEVRELESRHLTILEVGGAFAHSFDELLNFIGMPTLVITDLDTVAAYQIANGQTRYRACMTNEPSAVTSNAAIKHWLGKDKTAAELLGLSDADKVVATEEKHGAHIRVAYQTLIPATWGGTTEMRVGRTLEEAFALQNLDWLHDGASKGLALRIEDADTLPLQELHSRIYARVRDDLDKTEFALTLIADPNPKWASPAYIVEGLVWLRGQLEDAPTTPTLE